MDKEYKCVYLEAEDIGGTKEITYYGYYCRKKDLYNDKIKCEGCKECLLEEDVDFVARTRYLKLY